MSNFGRWEYLSTTSLCLNHRGAFFGVSRNMSLCYHVAAGWVRTQPRLCSFWLLAFVLPFASSTKIDDDAEGKDKGKKKATHTEGRSVGIAYSDFPVKIERFSSCNHSISAKWSRIFNCWFFFLRKIQIHAKDFILIHNWGPVVQMHFDFVGNASVPTPPGLGLGSGSVFMLCFRGLICLD